MVSFQILPKPFTKSSLLFDAVCMHEMLPLFFIYNVQQMKLLLALDEFT